MATVLGYLKLDVGQLQLMLVVYQETPQENKAKIGPWLSDEQTNHSFAYVAERGAYFPLQPAIYAIEEKGEMLEGFPKSLGQPTLVSNGDMRLDLAVGVWHYLGKLEQAHYITSFVNYGGGKPFNPELPQISKEEWTTFLLWFYRERFTLAWVAGNAAVDECDTILFNEDEYQKEYARGDKNDRKRDKLNMINKNTVFFKVFKTPGERDHYYDGFVKRGGTPFQPLSIQTQDLLVKEYGLLDVFVY